MKYIVYGIPNCAACQKAKLLLQMKSKEFEYKEIGTDINESDVERLFGGQLKSAPQIIKVGSGGFNEIVGNYQQLEEELKTK